MKALEYITHVGKTQQLIEKSISSQLIIILKTSMPEFQTPTYKTKDLGESAALIIKNMKFIRIDREGRICWFVFENKSECEKFSSDFFFGELLVNAREYYEALGRLKNRIFST